MPAVLEIRTIADCCYQRGAVLGPIPWILAILTIIRHSLCAIAYCCRPSKEDKESSSGDVGPVLSASFNRP